MKSTYTCRGDVCGSCPHRHSTISGAEKCLKTHASGCHSQGGYSDRMIYRSDGERMVRADPYDDDAGWTTFAEYIAEEDALEMELQRQREHDRD